MLIVPQNISAPNAITVVINSPILGPDLTAVLGVTFSVLRYDGSVTTWTGEIKAQTPRELVVQYVFTGSELTTTGMYRLQPLCAVESGVYPAESVNLMVSNAYSTHANLEESAWIVATSSIAGPPISNVTDTQSGWKVDPINGDDAATGLPSAPLKTFGELARRWGVAGLIAPTGGTCDVEITSDLPPTDLMGFVVSIAPSCSLRIHGTYTTIASGTISAVTVAVPSTNTAWQITDAGMTTWTVGSLVVTNTGATFYIEKDLGSGSARISRPLAGTTNVAATVNPGDTYTISSMVGVRVGHIIVLGWGPNISTGGTYTLENLSLAGGTSEVIEETVSGIKQNLVRCTATGILNVFTDLGLANAITNCWLARGVFTAGATNIYGGVAKGNVIVEPGTLIAMSRGAMISAAQLLVRTGASAQLGDVQIWDCANTGGAIALSQNASCTFTDVIYGSGNAGYGVSLAATSTITYVTGLATPTLTGTSGDIVFGLTRTSEWVWDDTLGTYAPKQSLTWSNVFGATFNGTVKSPLTGAGIVKLV